MLMGSWFLKFTESLVYGISLGYHGFNSCLFKVVISVFFNLKSKSLFNIIS